MKIRIRSIQSIIIGIVVMLNSCCKKDVDKTSFETATVTDIDGNIYNTVKINNQWWMSDNLKVIQYQDGSPIENVSDSTAWGFLTTGAYCWCDNNPSLKNTYGAYYNWYAVIDNRNLCPSGWHVPSNTEWENLIGYLGGDSEAGEKIVSNEISFSAVFAGYRSNPVLFYGASFKTMFWYVTRRGDWWSSSEGPTVGYAYKVELISKPNYPYTALSSGGANPKSEGLSVRCVKN
jgi:uncharacterized protein (TIGR02145 family)